MGTRADFYVGDGKDAEWIGSVAWDGYEFEEDREHEISAALTDAAFREAVAVELAKRDDATTAEMGWPWPWDDSRTTDYAYCFVNGKVEYYCFGRPVSDKPEDIDDIPKREDWPDMKESKRLAKAGSSRSGIICISRG